MKQKKAGIYVPRGTVEAFLKARSGLLQRRRTWIKDATGRRGYYRMQWVAPEKAKAQVGRNQLSLFEEAAGKTPAITKKTGVPSGAMYLRVEGAKHLEPVSSLKEASEKYCQVRDMAGVGATKTPNVDVVDGNNNVIGIISYNGRIWKPEDYATGKIGDKVPIYDNRTRPWKPWDPNIPPAEKIIDMSTEAYHSGARGAKQYQKAIASLKAAYPELYADAESLAKTAFDYPPRNYGSEGWFSTASIKIDGETYQLGEAYNAAKYPMAAKIYECALRLALLYEDGKLTRGAIDRAIATHKQNEEAKGTDDDAEGKEDTNGALRLDSSELPSLAPVRKSIISIFRNGLSKAFFGR